MVLDRLEGGSVDGLWREQGKLSEDHASHIILQVVSAVRYCHDKGIAVRRGQGRGSLYREFCVWKSTIPGKNAQGSKVREICLVLRLVW